MKKKIFILALMYQAVVIADVSTNQLKEVSYLLDYIKNTQCVINRNGTNYNGKQAVKHIEKKYNYYRDDIKNTEDFIRLSATKSTMSGNHYTVKCSTEIKTTTQQWLLNELSRYRNKEMASDKKR